MSKIESALDLLELDEYSHPALNRTTGMKRLKCEWETREQQQITQQILYHFFKKFKINILESANLHVTFYLALTNVLQIRELTDVDRSEFNLKVHIYS